MAGMRVEVCPDEGRAMRSSPLRRQAQRFGRRHSQPPIEFPCSAPQRDGKSPKTTGNPANVGWDEWRELDPDTARLVRAAVSSRSPRQLRMVWHMLAARAELARAVR